MKIMIKYRLFLAMLAATVAVVVCMFLIMQWSIGRGFLAYVNTIEIERMERLAEVLEQDYTAQGNWEFLRGDPMVWFRIVESTLPREAGDPERSERRERRFQHKLKATEADQARQDLNQRQQHLARRDLNPAVPGFPNRTGLKLPPRPPHRFESRVILLDSGRNRIVGPAGELGRVNLKKIVSQGRVVGYLGMLPRQRLTDTHQLLFVQQQKLAMALIAGVMLLISAAISLPLANRLVLPIRRLAASMHRLASGEFDTRVAVGPQDELGQLARDFNTLALSLGNTEQARRQWVADISHELRTPLSILRGEIEAIQDGVRQAGPDSMRSLHAEVMRLSRLVDDLYQLSLSDIGALSYRKINLDLRSLLADAVTSFRPEFAQKGIEVRTELAAEGNCTVFADPGRLHQLFDNLMDNALKYTDPGGVFSLRLECRGHLASIVLADSAPGVGADDLERIFDRLYRVESSRNRALGGAGLGLAICRNIVEAHEGKISALPSPLGGVQIRIELPVTGSDT
jgi:two-component system, OmpR family, sensor histidine kinase BaeS